MIEGGPDPSARRVESVADIDALITDTAAVLVVRPDDRKLAALGRLNALRRLYREGPSQVTDSGLCYLVTFPLEVLELGESSQITDHGLVELRLIRSLRWLEVTGCPRSPWPGSRRSRRRFHGVRSSRSRCLMRKSLDRQTSIINMRRSRIGLGLAGVFAVAAAAGLWTAPAWLIDRIARWFSGCLYRVSTRAPLLALTIDDGPDPSTTPLILAERAQHSF